MSAFKFKSEAQSKEGHMKRVTPEMLSDMLDDNAKTVLLFGAPTGEPTMAQASDFADAWTDHHDRAAFGYVDAFAHVSLARAFGIRVLPTTLVMDGHDVVARLEGRCSAARIAVALLAPTERRAAA
jgi:thioredoxin-like negative regulator of GroEL